MSTEHKQVHVAWPGVGEADVDQGIADLILALWQRDIITSHSCQDSRLSPGPPRAMVALSSRSAERFLTAVMEPLESDDDDRLFLPSNLLPPDWYRLTTPVWRRLLRRPIPGYGLEEGWRSDYSILGPHTSGPGYRIRIFLYFPFEDIPVILRRLRYRLPVT